MSKFNQAFQVYPFLVEEATLTLGAARIKRIINLKEKLPLMLRNKVAHVIGFVTEIAATPTFTTAPNQLGFTSAFRSVVMVADGGRTAIDVSGLDLRAIEAYENGGQIVHPLPDLNGGTGTLFTDARSIDLGPGNFVGNPSDYAMPCALLDTGTLQLEAPALTDISADTTAATVVQRTYAMIIAMDSIRIPPKMELRGYNTGGNTLELGERALYASLLMCSNAAHGLLTNGLIGNITLTDRRGPIFNGINASILGKQFNTQMAPGQFSIIQGEPRGTTDHNPKMINQATPTAVLAAAASYQPVLWSPNGSRLPKVEAEGPIKLTWDGSQATAYIVVRRFIPRGEQEASDLATVAFNKLNLKFTGGRINTQDGQLFIDPNRIEYMPWDFSYAK